MPPSDWLPPWLQETVAPILAMMIIVGGYATLWVYPELKTEIVALMMAVIMFYFGSSRGSEHKTEILADNARVAAVASVDTARVLAAGIKTKPVDPVGEAHDYKAQTAATVVKAEIAADNAVSNVEDLTKKEGK